MLPKLICALPLTVHLAVTLHDIATADIGSSISPVHNTILILVELVVFIFLIDLTEKAITRHFQLDRIWNDWWEDIRKAGLAA